MPGSVANATPTTVLPLTLCRSFVHSRKYPVQVNEYRNGESQRGRLADTSRKSWHTGKRLTASELQALRDFYDARKGPQEPFYFYDPWETVPKFTYDPTGQTVAGRYTVRFEGAWEQSVVLGRVEVNIPVIEIA
jgi:hypothetical protein